MEKLEEAAIALQGEWGLEIPELISEETILSKLTERVEQLIEKGGEEFFQLMYRLDISEKKLHGVMHEADIAWQIAKLIYARQIQKIESRAIYSKPPVDGDDDLKW